MKIIADENIPKVDEFLAGMGTVRCLPGRTIAYSDLRDADVLLVRSVTQVNEALLKGSSIKFVASATAGIDHIDQDYLRDTGVHFSWAPGCNAMAVVEYVLAAITQAYLARNVPWMDKTVGIIGRGQVGRRLHGRLLAAGVDCLVYDPFFPAINGWNVSLREVLSKADILTLHTPLTRSGSFPSWHMIDARELALMKDEALLINASRGGVVNNKALSLHLENHRNFMAVLDVWEGEPALDMKLLKQVFIGTGHIAGYSLEGKLRGTKQVYDALCGFSGRAVSVEMDDFLSEGPASCLNIENTKEACLADLIKQLYDIKADSEQFKSMMVSSCDENKRASIFDQYRRTYPVRREFSSMVGNGESGRILHQNPALGTLIASLGFDAIN